MTVSLDIHARSPTRWHQYAVRFVLGGAITVAAGLIAREFGPEIGGLFLAFPAIFPATATLISHREEERKARHGLDGERRGRQAAAIDAAGSVLGAVGLWCFALVIWQGLPRYPATVVLPAAALFWLGFSLALWWIRKHAAIGVRRRSAVRRKLAKDRD
jgi:hypothetical protein